MQHHSLQWVAMEHSIGGPDYRWKLAEKRADSNQHVAMNNLDDVTAQAADYLRVCHQSEMGHTRAQRKFPTIDAACAFFQNQKAFELFKLSLLGSLPTSEISARLKVDQGVLTTAEALFFDLRGMRAALSWMNAFVFLPEIKAGNTDLAAKMKLAFHGGPEVTRDLLDAQEGLPMETALRLADQETLLHGKLQAALGFNMDATTSAEFVKIFLEYDIARRQLDLAREKFQHECEVVRQQRNDVAAGLDRDDGSGNPCRTPDEISVNDAARDIELADAASADDERLVA